MIRLFLCILALILGGYGALCIFDPEMAIYLTTYWRFNNAEPSDRFLLLTKIGGFFYIGLAISVVVMAFVAL